jgi:hypothetical protein
MKAIPLRMHFFGGINITSELWVKTFGILTFYPIRDDIRIYLSRKYPYVLTNYHSELRRAVHV